MRVHFDGRERQLQNYYELSIYMRISIRWSKEFRLSVTDWMYRNMPWSTLPALEINNMFALLSDQVVQAVAQNGTVDEDIEHAEIGNSSFQPDRRRRNRNKNNDKIWIKVEWKRKEMEIVDLNRILRIVSKLHPLPERETKTSISYSLGKPTGVWMNNVYRESAIQLYVLVRYTRCYN